MRLEIGESAIPLTEEDVVRAEQRMGRSLPAAYRAFLLVHNGGRPEPYAFRMQAKGSRESQGGCVEWFLGIGTGTNYNDLETIVRWVRGRVPANLLPIGTDTGGNLICLSASGPDAGAVYFWDHEFERDLPTYGNVYFIASTFEEFLNSLYAYGED